MKDNYVELYKSLNFIRKFNNLYYDEITDDNIHTILNTERLKANSNSLNDTSDSSKEESFINTNEPDLLSSRIVIKNIILLSLLLSCTAYLFFSSVSEFRLFRKSNLVYYFTLPHFLSYFIFGWFNTKFGRKVSIWLCLSLIIILDGSKMFYNDNMTYSLILFLIKRILVYNSQAPAYILATELMNTNNRVYALTIIGSVALGAASLSPFLYEYFKETIYLVNCSLSVLGCVIVLFLKETKDKLLD